MRPTAAKIMRLLGIVALLAVVIFLMLFLDRFRFNSQTVFWQAVMNFGHAPLFGVMAVIILWLLQLSVGMRFGAFLPYFVAWLAAVGMGAVSEYIQIFSARNADVMDLVYDIFGITAFLAVYFSIDPRLPDSEKRLQGRIKMPLRITAVIIMLGAGIPVFTGAAAGRYRRNAFPEMFTFDSNLEKKFIESPYAVLELVEPPGEWPGRDSRVGRVTFLPSKYPGLAFRGPYPDWRGYKALTLDVFSPAGSPVSINLMIKDDDAASFHERYNRELQIYPGLNEIRVPLSEIENSPKNRVLDLSSIKVIHLFLVEPQQPVVLYLDDLFLE